MAREFPIANGKLVTDLDANGHKILNAQGGGGELPDLSDYAKKSDLDGYATKEQLNAVGNIAQGAADGVSFAIGEVNKLEQGFGAKRDRTDNIAAADGTEFTEWKFRCDVPEIQAALDAATDIDVSISIMPNGLWGLSVLGLPQVDGWVLDETFANTIIVESPDVESFTAYDGVYSKDNYSVKVGFTATRTKVFTTKTGEPYVTPTGVKALTDGKQDTLTDAQIAAVNSGVTKTFVETWQNDCPGNFAYKGELDAAIWGCIPKYEFVDAAIADGKVTVAPYTNAKLISNGAAFTVAVGEGDGKTRDCVLRVECGETAPTITWGTNFHPRTNAETDFACEVGVRNVYWITEHSPNEFCVAGWQETDGGGTSGGAA
jgi:hypothetical protein